jgi:outer membrane protein assembly factor BamB
MKRRTYLQATAGLTTLAGCVRLPGGGQATETVTCENATSASRTDATRAELEGSWRTLLGDPENTGDRSDTVGPRTCPEIRWSQSPSHPAGEGIQVFFDNPPVVVADLVLVANKNVLYAFESTTGDISWRARLHGSLDPPVVVDDTAYLGSRTGVHAVALRDGSERWLRETPSRVRAATKADADRVYATTGEHEVLAVGFDGTITWETAVPAVERPERDVQSERFGPPAIGEDLLVVGGFDGTVVALDVTTGERTWIRTFDDTLSRAPTLGDGVVYVAGQTFLRALDLSTGATVWTAFENEVVFGSTASVARDETLYVQAGTSYESPNLVALDADTGQERWWTAVALPEASPVVGRDHVYLGAGSELIAIDRETHEVAWRMDPGSDIHGHPVLLDRTVFLSTVSEGLFAVT